MRQQPTSDSIQLSTASGFAVCDGLLRMAHCLMTALPEPELRNIRFTLGALTARADHLLESTEFDLALNFDNLAVDAENRSPYPGAEDFGAILVSTSVSTTTTDETGSTFAPSPRRNTSSRVPVFATTPAPTPARVPTPAPTPPKIPSHGNFPYVISTRGGVGMPEYDYHPYFVRPGVPGPYEHPPTVSGLACRDGYYVVSRGLYVGIFTDWNEVAPWVNGVSGSAHRKVKTWDEARDIYNQRLSAGAIRILS